MTISKEIGELVSSLQRISKIKRATGHARLTELFLRKANWHKNPGGSWSHESFGKGLKRPIAFKVQIAKDIRELARLKKQAEAREKIISTALDTPEGRLILARAMVEPIKTALLYRAIGRKLLMVDVLPPLEPFSRYERDTGYTNQHANTKSRTRRSNRRNPQNKGVKR